MFKLNDKVTIKSDSALNTNFELVPIPTNTGRLACDLALNGAWIVEIDQEHYFINERDMELDK